MKVAVTATGPTLDSPVDEHFGRAPYFLIVNLEDESFEAIDNSANAAGFSGVGLQAGQMVAEKGVDWVITGVVGPKAYSVLEGAGVKIAIGASGTVRDTITRFNEGGFEATTWEQCGPQGIGKPRGMGRGRGGGQGRK